MMKFAFSCLIIISALSSVAAFSCKQCCHISKDLKAQNDIKHMINETLKDVLDSWNTKYLAQETETATLKRMVQELKEKVESLRGKQNSTRSCPSGWVIYRSSCYKFIQSPLKTWTGAKAYCESLQSNLVEIENNSENEFLREHLAPLITTNLRPIIHSNQSPDIKARENQFWIGNSDSVNEGVWTWTTTESKCEYTDWHSKEPTGSYKYWSSFQEPNGGTSENCGTMKAGFNYHWNDEQCSREFNFICEKQI